MSRVHDTMACKYLPGAMEMFMNIIKRKIGVIHMNIPVNRQLNAPLLNIMK